MGMRVKIYQPLFSFFTFSFSISSPFPSWQPMFSAKLEKSEALIGTTENEKKRICARKILRKRKKRKRGSQQINDKIKTSENMHRKR